MDFNKFDSRTRAEQGAPMQILDPISGDPVLDGDKPCRVIVRGVASPSMQAKMRAKQKAAMQSKAAKGKDAKAEARVMEDMHMDLCNGAAPYIVGFENVSRGDKPATVDDVEWFLDLSFPEMDIKKDANGDTVMTEVRDDDGELVKVPSFELVNNPFAKQIAEFAGKQANFLDSTKTD